MHNRDEETRLFTPGFILASLATFTLFVSFSPLLATLPIYAIQMGAGEIEVGLIIGAFATTAVFFRPLTGRETDRRGAKGLMLVGALIFLVAALLYDFARTVPLLLLLRVFHGIGMAAFTTASSAYVACVAPPKRRGEAMSYYGMANNLAIAVGPAAGIFVMNSFGFTTLFLSLAVVGLVTILLVALLDEEPSVRAANPEWFSRPALFPSAILVALTLTLGGILSFLPLFALEREIDPQGVGWYFTVYAIALIISRAFAGTVSDRFGRPAAVVPGLAAVALALGILSLTRDLPTLLLVAAVYGVGFAAVHPTLMALTIDRAPAHGRGAAMATFSAAMDLGIGVGSMFWGLVVATSGFTQMWLLAGAVSIAGLIAYVIGWRAKV